MDISVFSLNYIYETIKWCGIFYAKKFLCMSSGGNVVYLEHWDKNILEIV